MTARKLIRLENIGRLLTGRPPGAGASAAYSTSIVGVDAKAVKYL